jgi:hypothetical protein
LHPSDSGDAAVVICICRAAAGDPREVWMVKYFVMHWRLSVAKVYVGFSSPE